jgi:uncharacterized protein
MSHFVGRQSEIAALDRLLKDRSRLAQFIVVYGRRRVGKTTLLLHWAKHTGQPTLYWVARRETPDATRQSLARAVWAWAYPEGENNEPPIFKDWEGLFREIARLIGDRPLIMIWDEFPYAAESDPSLPSHLQAAWDHLFKDRPIMLILSGSHIGMMVDLMAYSAPLYGRFTAQFPLGPLPFAMLDHFFPKYEAVERVSAYACLGGIPAYLERFDPDQDVQANIQRHLFSRTGMFRSEPALLISDLVRETRIYESILRSIAGGAHTPADMVQPGQSTANLAPYIKRLLELKLVERRIPATIPLAQRETTNRSRYHLSDPYLRFYYRFVEPNLEMIEQGQIEALWRRVSSQFRAFVGMTTFEELCREWVIKQAQASRLPFTPDFVGSHWAPDAQIDVVAISWQEKAILLGECKWGVEPIRRSIVRDLVEKTPKVTPGEGWRVTYALFSRAGFTEAAASANEEATFIDLAGLDADLKRKNPPARGLGDLQL